MQDGYFDDILNTLNRIYSRKFAVMEQLSQFRDSDNNEAPVVPQCLLQTEFGLLQKLSDALERELSHYTSINKESSDTLACTISGMVSTDWKERLKAEWAQLCIRMERLDNFRDSFREDKHGFVEKWDERLLCDQLRAMRTYRDCLLAYAKLEDVELDMTLYNDDYRYDYYFKNQDSE